MKTALQAAAALLGGTLLSTSSARAQLPVTDAVSIAARAVQAAQNIAQLAQQLEQLKATYEILARRIETGDMAGILNSPLLRNSMPAYGQTGAYVNGTGSAPGSEQFTQRNLYYRPEGDDFTATEMTRSAQGVANVQAMAQQNLQSLQERIEGLGELKDQVDNAQSNGDILALQARIQSEQAFISAQSTQASQLQVMLAAQDRVDQQRIDQKIRQDAEQQARDFGGGGGGQLAPTTVPAFALNGG